MAIYQDLVLTTEPQPTFVPLAWETGGRWGTRRRVSSPEAPTRSCDGTSQPQTPDRIADTRFAVVGQSEDGSPVVGTKDHQPTLPPTFQRRGDWLWQGGLRPQGDRYITTEHVPATRYNGRYEREPDGRYEKRLILDRRFPEELLAKFERQNRLIATLRRESVDVLRAPPRLIASL